MSDNEDFEEQLRLEEEERKFKNKTVDIEDGRIRTDSDGTIYEWNAEKQAWFPKIDENTIVQYQMSYGSSTTSQQPYINTDTPEYREWYEKYVKYCEEYAKAQSVTGETVEGSESLNDTEKANAIYWQQYYAYWYQQQQQEQPPTNSESKVPQTSTTNHNENAADENDTEKDDQKKKKKKPADVPASWFEAGDQSPPSVYVSGLPNDITDDEFKELMNKCGLIAFDPLTRKLKLKLYRDSNGQLKGDGWCCYIKTESVDLALQILDEYNLRGSIIRVEKAKFEMKGHFDPTKKKRKLTSKEKQKIKAKQEKLFDWRPDEPVVGTRPKHERIVILKNLFSPEEFVKEPQKINDVRDDIRTECSKFGDVKKVVVYDHNPDGIAAVTMKDPEEADVCIAALHMRWFAGRRILAENWDGKTKYEVEESEAEKEKRLKQWEEYLLEDERIKKLKEEAEKNKDTIQKSDSEMENDSNKSDDSESEESADTVNTSYDTPT